MAVRQPNFLPTHLVGGWPWLVMLYDPYHPQSCSPAPQLGSLFSPYPVHTPQCSAVPLVLLLHPPQSRAWVLRVLGAHAGWSYANAPPVPP